MNTHAIIFIAGIVVGFLGRRIDALKYIPLLLVAALAAGYFLPTQLSFLGLAIPALAGISLVVLVLNGGK